MGVQVNGCNYVALEVRRGESGRFLDPRRGVGSVYGHLNSACLATAFATVRKFFNTSDGEFRNQNNLS